MADRARKSNELAVDILEKAGGPIRESEIFLLGNSRADTRRT